MGLFSQEKESNLDRIAAAIHNTLGLQLIQPSPEVLQVLDELTSRDLVNFDNARSIEGMQELFRVKSLRAVVDALARSVSLQIMDRTEIERELQAEHTQVKVMHFAERHSTQKIVRPTDAAEQVKPVVSKPSLSATPLGAVPAEFEHLDGVEQLCASLADLFVRHGQLTSADKDVLKNIRPTDSSLGARITALERWQAELTRRARALSVPKPMHTLSLGGTDENAPQEKPEVALLRRFDSIVSWLGKLVKSFESTGIRMHTKPVWLPH